MKNKEIGRWFISIKTQSKEWKMRLLKWFGPVEKVEQNRLKKMVYNSG